MPWTALNTIILAAAVLAFSATTSVYAQLPYGCPSGYFYDTHFGRCIPFSYPGAGQAAGLGGSAPSNGSPEQPSPQYGTSHRQSGADNSNPSGSNGSETSGTTH